MESVIKLSTTFTVIVLQKMRRVGANLAMGGARYSKGQDRMEEKALLLDPRETGGACQSYWDEKAQVLLSPLPQFQ